MPIVLNGITKRNGGTVTFNGTSLKEVQFNGTTVWKAETDITSLFSASDYYHPNGAYQARSKSGNTINLNATPSSCRNIWTPAIDLSQYNTLTFTVNVTTANQQAGNNPVRWFYVMANASNTFTGDFGHRSDLSNPSSTGTSYSQIWGSTPRNTEFNVGTRTITVDISSWTGSLKLGLCASCGGANTFSVAVTNVKLQ